MGIFDRIASGAVVSPAGPISSGGASLPSQGGNSGKFLTTDGSTTSWGTVVSSSTWSAAKWLSADIATSFTAQSGVPTIYGDSLLSGPFQIITTDIGTGDTVNIPQDLYVAAGSTVDGGNANAGATLYLRGGHGSAGPGGHVVLMPGTGGTPAGKIKLQPSVAAVVGQVWTATDVDGSGHWATSGGGFTSPLTTKGDVHGFSTVDARIPVGSNNQVLTADSTQALGLKWATPAASASSSGASGLIQISDGSGGFTTSTAYLNSGNLALLDYNTSGTTRWIGAAGLSSSFTAGQGATGMGIVINGSNFGSIIFRTNNSGVDNNDRLTIATDGALTASKYGAGVATFSAAGLISSVAPGTSGNVLTSNGTAWVSQAASAGAPAGATGNIQFNNAGAFGGVSTLQWDNTNSSLSFGPTTGGAITASGLGSHAGGRTTTSGTSVIQATGIAAMAQGWADNGGILRATGATSAAWGYAGGTGSIVQASGSGPSFIMAYGDTGAVLTSSGRASMVLGWVSGSAHTMTASGNGSFAGGADEGLTDHGSITASGNASMAHGSQINVSGANAHAFGIGIVASSYASLVAGRYPAATGTAGSWVTTDPLFALGNGTASGSTSNAFLIRKDGTGYIGGALGVGTSSPFSGALLTNSTANIIASDGNGLNNNQSFVWATTAAGYAVGIYNGTATNGPGMFIKIRDTASTALLIDQGATIGGTGTLLFRVIGTGDATLKGSFAMNGSTSGVFTQSAAVTTTSYSVKWPAAQGSGNLQNDGSGNLSWVAASSGVALSALTAATAGNTIANANFAQVWNWDTLGANTALKIASADASFSGILLNLSASSTTDTGTCLSISELGTGGTGLAISRTGTGGTSALNTITDSSTSGATGLSVNMTGTSGAEVGLSITNASAATTAKGININMSGGSSTPTGISITAATSGVGRCIDINNSSTSSAAYGLYITQAGQGYGIRIDKTLAATSSGAILINDGANSSNTIDISKTATGGSGNGLNLTNSSTSGGGGINVSMGGATGAQTALVVSQTSASGLPVGFSAGGTGTREIQRLINNSTATLNNAAQLSFASSRTTSGQTTVAGISGIITNIGNTTYTGALAFLTSSTNAAPTEKMRVQADGSLLFPFTNTAGGTTGAQTIDKISGTVNFATNAGAPVSLVVTNALVTTSSIVLAVIRTNDTTATLNCVVPANGSFTIFLSAGPTTTETSVGFFVINQ